MIVVDIFSGLGNQMFMYAYARAMQIKYNEKLFLNFAPLIWHKRNCSRSYSLHHFVLNDKAIVPPKILMFALDLFGKVKRWRLTKNKLDNLYGSESFYRLSSKGMYANHDVYRYYPDKGYKGTKFLIGFWQTEKYFKDISSVIKKELRVKTLPTDENAKMIDEIRNCNSVCVHIRLGDYCNPENEALFICKEDYYKKGMKVIAENTDNPVFYVFSYSHKDIQWIQDNYKFDYPVRYVDLNNPDYEELRLMYNCNHFIIANSTFSWWAQYLGDAPDKIVVAPSVWTHETHQDASDIFMGNWKLVNIE